MSKISLSFALALLASTPVLATEEAAATTAAAQSAATKLESLADRASYLIGFNLGGNLKQQEVPVSYELLARGLQEGLAGAEGLFTPEETQAVMVEFQQMMVAKQEAKAAAVGAENLRAGTEFLATNGAREGVITTASGLQYEVLAPGDGLTPAATDVVTVHYTGTLLDGTVFDSSVERNEPATFGVSQVIAGWVEALQLMRVGAKWKLFIPANLAYGEAGAGGVIGPSATLVFEVELLDVQRAPAEAAAAATASPADN